MIPAIIRERWRVVLIGLVLCAMGAWAILGMGENVGYSPTQPLPFSHRLHAGENHIPCQYCHAGVSQDRLAPIPPLNVCMGCHQVVANGAAPIKQLAAAYAAQKPIEWIRVYDLPQFVKFQHRFHIAAGIACQTCHGPVQDMDQIEQVRQFTMAECLNCHRDNSYLPTPNDQYHRDPASFHGQPANAPQDCSVCHN